MRKALTEIAEAHPNGTVAVFSHGMAMRIIVGALQGMTLHEIDKTGHAENTAVAKLEYENGAFNVAFRDDVSHLGDNIATVRKQPWVNDPNGFEGGIYYRASGEAGHFDVMHGEEIIGAVSVESCRGGVGTISEFWLENDAQKKGLGEKLVGQALSYARAHGCSILSTGRIPKSNAVALHLSLIHIFPRPAPRVLRSSYVLSPLSFVFLMRFDRINCSSYPTHKAVQSQPLPAAARQRKA